MTQQVCEGLPAGEYEIREAQPEDVSVRLLAKGSITSFLLMQRPKCQSRLVDAVAAYRCQIHGVSEIKHSSRM